MTLYELFEINRLDGEIEALERQIRRLQEQRREIINRSNANKEKPHERA
ncbi:hypothetical protein [Edwardsiella piscicida]|nr:hypothetical protein [Edwardsiella piscicida]WGS75570.1 hypothetical protein PED68_09330 [Edwardsiella piscicida]WGS78959.1 hypothetical protein PED70_09335 [Edwardsiella piscicida]